MRRARVAARWALALAVAAACAAAPAGAQGPDPRLAWRTLATPHFRVHFPAGLEEQARRAAANAERAWRQLAAELAPPRGTVDLVVADNVDFAQGYATPFPSNRIVVFAQPPVENLALRFYDDWSQLVITHELAHVFHLDRVRGGWRALQYVFGRNPALFPNAYGPAWVSEGLAVYYESRLTGAGRLVGTQHRVLARAAALDRGRVPRPDEWSLASSEFPGGQQAYAYGSLLVDWMARHHGAAKVRDFVDFTSGQLLPWRLDWAADRTFGEPFRRGWRRWADSVTRSVPRGAGAALADAAGGPASGDGAGAAWRELTRSAWELEYPRWADSTSLVYAATVPGEVTGAYRVTLDGRRRRLGRRNSASPNVPLAGGGLLFAQQDFVDPFTVRGDLWVQADTGRFLDFGAARGSERRLTRGARLAHPDARADGEIVAVQAAGGTTRLVRVSRDGRTIAPLTAAHPDTQWTEPRWSPDGARLAAVRLERGGTSAVVILDPAGGAAREVVRDRAVNAAPGWSHDGRYVLWSSDRTGAPQPWMRLADPDSARAAGAAPMQPEPALVAGVEAGVRQPVARPVPAAGAPALAGTLLRADGYRLGVTQGAPTAAPAAGAGHYPQESRVPPVARDSSPARPYSPWRTLAPRYWSPLVGEADGGGTLWGAGTSGADVLGRHAYAAEAYVNGSTGDAEAFAAWRYARLGQPLVDVSVGQTWQYDTVGVEFTDGSRADVPLDRRERTVTAALTFQRPRVRTSGVLSLGASYEDRAYQSTLAALPGLVARETGTAFPSVFVTAGWSNARRPLRSISPEDGVSATATAEQRWGDPDGASRQVVGVGRLYKSLALPGFAHHALALRVAGGAADARASSELSAGGTSGSAGALVPGVVVGTAGRTFGVRGFPAGAQRGLRAAAASAEYRAPVALPARGVALLPLFLDRVSVTAFAEAASAWCPPAIDRAEQPLCRASRVRTPERASWLASAGAELNLDAALQYDAPLRVRIGAARPLRNRSLADGDVVPYLTLGLSF